MPMEDDGGGLVPVDSLNIQGPAQQGGRLTAVPITDDTPLSPMQQIELAKQRAEQEGMGDTGGETVEEREIPLPPNVGKLLADLGRKAEKEIDKLRADLAALSKEARQMSEELTRYIEKHGVLPADE